MGTDTNIVKVITTNDLYDEVVGLRTDVQQVLAEHKDIPARVEKLESTVADLLKFRWLLTGGVLVSGGAGAILTKLLGG